MWFMERLLVSGRLRPMATRAPGNARYAMGVGCIFRGGPLAMPPTPATRYFQRGP